MNNKVLIIKSCDERFLTAISTKYEYLTISLMHVVTCLDQESTLECIKAHRIIISSQNAVRALFQNISFLDKKYLTIENEIYAVGEKTAALLKQNSCSNISLVTQNMQEMISKLSRKEAYVYISGYDTSLHYCHGYEDLNIKRYIFYRTLPKRLSVNVSNTILNGEISYVMLYSRRNTEIFYNSLSEAQKLSLRNTIFICISQNVADIAHRYFSTYFTSSIRVAKQPTERSMLELL